MNSMDGPALLFWESHPCPTKLRLKMPRIRMSVRASIFGARLTVHPSVPRGTSLRARQTPNR